MQGHSSPRRVRALSVVLAALLLVQLQTGCGNEDYQKPIKQFQDASAVVIAGARQTLLQMNDVEENAELSRQVFQGEAFDEKKIKARDLITQEEIAVRTGALDQLARYTFALADLAALKAPADVTKQFQDVGSAFTTLAKDAGKLGGSQVFDNAKFSGAVQAATTGIGVVVRAIEERRARREIEKQIREQDAAVSSLIALIGDELQAAYQRRRQADSEEGVFLTAALKLELEKPARGDPALRLLLGHSRLLLGSDAYRRVKAPDVVDSFHKAAQLHGLPASLLSDNGAVFGVSSLRWDFSAPGRCSGLDSPQNEWNPRASRATKPFARSIDLMG